MLPSLGSFGRGGVISGWAPNGLVLVAGAAANKLFLALAGVLSFCGPSILGGENGVLFTCGILNAAGEEAPPLDFGDGSGLGSASPYTTWDRLLSVSANFFVKIASR